MIYIWGFCLLNLYNCNKFSRQNLQWNTLFLFKWCNTLVFLYIVNIICSIYICSTTECVMDSFIFASICQKSNLLKQIGNNLHRYPLYWTDLYFWFRTFRHLILNSSRHCNPGIRSMYSYETFLWASIGLSFRLIFPLKHFNINRLICSV